MSGLALISWALLGVACGDDEDTTPDQGSAGKLALAGSGGSGASAGVGDAGGADSNGGGADSNGGGADSGEAGAEGSPLYAIAAELETPQGNILYLDTVQDLTAPFDLEGTGIEIPDASTFKFYGQYVFVGENETPRITRYVLDSNDRLKKDLAISFSSVAVSSSAFDYTIISATKAYYYDVEDFKVYIWNPSTMELTGESIDFSDAYHPEYGGTYIGTQRDWTVWRGDQLFIPGGFWGDEPYPRSLLLAFDTAKDTVKILEDDRCTYLDNGVVTSSGDTYFLATHLGVALNEQLPWCSLVVRNGKNEFDPDYFLDVGEALGDQMFFEGHPGPGDIAYVIVPDLTRLPEETPRADVRSAAANDAQLWSLNLVDGEAEVVDSIPHFNDIRFTFDIGDGRVLANFHWLKTPEDPESDGYATRSVFYDLTSEDHPVEFPLGATSDSVRSRIADIGRLR